MCTKNKDVHNLVGLLIYHTCTYDSIGRKVANMGKVSKML
jgi:hypothetical protein